MTPIYTAQLQQTPSRPQTLMRTLAGALLAIAQCGALVGCSESSSGSVEMSGNAGAPGSIAEGGSTGIDDPLTEPGGDVDGVQYFGRWDLSDSTAAVASWGAVYLKTQFTGTSITLLMEDSGNEFEVQIDDGELVRLSGSAETSYLLASDLAPGTHSLALYRRTGGSFGRTVIRGFSLDPGEQLIAPERPVRKIEVLGDSISVGYGNEGTSGTSRETENGFMAYGPQLARLFGAQWSIIAHSGHGMVRNLGEDKADLSSGVHMDDEFQMTFFPGAGTNPAWDFERYQPDVLVVTLGTNDFAWPVWNMDPGADFELTEEEFVGGYSEFLTLARSVYPEAHVFALGTFVSNSTNQFGRCNDYICQAIEGMNDPKMHCIDPGATGEAWLPSGSDYIGDWTHPTVAGHTKIANKLKDKIAPVLGW